jgi:hypothetical protein
MSDWPDVTDWRAWTWETLTPAIFGDLFGQKLLRKLPIYRPLARPPAGERVARQWGTALSCAEGST